MGRPFWNWRYARCFCLSVGTFISDFFVTKHRARQAEVPMERPVLLDFPCCGGRSVVSVTSNSYTCLSAVWPYMRI